MKKILFILLVLLNLALRASLITDAETAAPSALIKCSPSGNSNGALSPSRAFYVISKNQELQLQPGNYNGVLVLGKNKLFLSGNEKGRCNATLRVISRDCVVRNIWLKKLIVQNNLVVVNSVIDYVCSENRTKGNQTVLFYNCCIKEVSNLHGNTKFIFVNCTLRNGNSIFTINNKTKLFLTNSVIDSGQFVLSITSSRSTKAKISLKDSFVHGLSGLAINSEMKNKSIPAAYSINELRKMINFNYSGFYPLKQPFFKFELPNSDDKHKIYEPKLFLQDKNSPCKSVGIIQNKIKYFNLKPEKQINPDHGSLPWELEFKKVEKKISELFKN